MRSLEAVFAAALEAAECVIARAIVVARRQVALVYVLLAVLPPGSVGTGAAVASQKARAVGPKKAGAMAAVVDPVPAEGACVIWRADADKTGS